MENPRPRSAFSSTKICGSDDHMARPDSGSMDRDLSRDMLALAVSVAAEVVAPLEAREPSDLAFTRRSEGNSWPSEPLSRL